MESHSTFQSASFSEKLAQKANFSGSAAAPADALNLNKPSHLHAAGCVLLASAVWATDSLMRYPMARDGKSAIDPLWIVFLEHAVGLLFIGAWVLMRAPLRRALTRVTARDLLPILGVGVGGSAVGGLLFTQAVAELGPAPATLFQMLQPLFVLGLAYLILKEKRSAAFLQCGIWAAVNAVLIGFPDLDFGSLIGAPLEAKHASGFLFAFLAVTAWGLSTVFGKILLRKHPPSVVVLLRWLSAVVFLGTVLLFRGPHIAAPDFASHALWGPLLFLAVPAGVVSMVIYYRGLQRLPAGVTTFLELMYPALGTFLPIWTFGGGVQPLQALGLGTLVVSLWLLLGLDFKWQKASAARPTAVSVG